MINCNSLHLCGSPTQDIFEPQAKGLSRQSIDGVQIYINAELLQSKQKSNPNEVFPKLFSLGTDILMCFIISNICSNLSR